jgi:hypothetical protein
MRGGTSKGIFIEIKHLPSDKGQWEKIICALFGSPDRRQINGLGGADPLTSKVALIGPPTRPDADVDYTFGQVSITAHKVDFKGNCGNISSAVGPFAIEHGYVKPLSPVTEIRIHNTNTGKLIKSYVPVENGKVKYSGEYQIDGVPGKAARIELDFADTRGAGTGKLLPTGNLRDYLNVPGIGKLECSIVDYANPVVFIRAADLGLTGREQPPEIDSNSALTEKLEAIRGAAAALIGFCKDAHSSKEESPARPQLAFVSPPNGNDTVTINSRLMFMQVMHKAYSLTATICTGVAVSLTGTIPAEVAGEIIDNKIIIGHPAGCIDVIVKAQNKGSDWIIEKAIVGRTARKLMEGIAYYML